MKSITKALAKGTIGTVAAGAMAMASASPAFARDHKDGIDGKDILVGALVLGGIAAVAAAASSDKDRYDRRYDDRYRGDRSRYGVSQREAVNMCVRAAERTAQRYGGTRAEVYDIRDVDRERNGYEVKGRIAVREGYGSRYNDRRGRNYNRGDGWDEGKFTCDVRRGRVVDLDFSGIRGL